jgi:hypothetical protein
VTLRVSFHVPFPVKSSPHCGGRVVVFFFSPSNLAVVNPVSRGLQVKRCEKRGHLGNGNHDMSLKSLKAGLKSNASVTGSVPESSWPPGGSLQVQEDSQEGLAGSQGAAAGSLIQEGPTVPCSTQSPEPGAHLESASTRGPGWRWEPHYPRPRPRDSHALWPLRDSPPQRPRLSKLTGNCSGRKRRAALWTTSPGRPHTAPRRSGPTRMLIREELGLSGAST